MDFDYLFKEYRSLLDDWDIFQEKLTKFMLSEAHIKEKNIKDVLSKLAAHPPENCRDAALLWALHGYMVPTNKLVRKDKQGLKTTIRYTVRDSQESFLFQRRNIQSKEEHIKFLLERSESVQPFIVVIGPMFGARHLQTLLLFLAIVVNYAARLNISVSLVAMTDAKTTNPNFHEFDWNEKQKSYILSSFFWGYTLFQFPGGYAARRFGVKTAIFICTFGSSILGLMVPFCVFWGGWKIFCVIRILQGMCQGLLFPCVYQHLAKWSPIEERNRLGGVTHMGTEIGTISAMYLTGMVAASDWGWPGISYVFCGNGLVVSIIWIIFAENSPGGAKLISFAEKHYILSSQASMEDEKSKTKIPIPWKQMLLSGPLISLIIVRLCDTWGFVTMQAQIPAYLHGALQMDIRNNAFFSALPYMTMTVFSISFLISADVVLNKKWASLLVVRKTINTIAMWGPAALLIGIGFLDENQKGLAITFITLNVGFNGGHIIGSLLNLIDLSPNHAGILMAIANTLANIIPIVSPIVVGIIVNDETQRLQWQIIFIIAAVLFFVGNLQFLFFAKTDAQSWDAKDFSIRKKNDTERSVENIKSPPKYSEDINSSAPVSKLKETNK